MLDQTDRLAEPLRYTVKDRRYVDGQWVTSRQTATATHTVENYRDVWTQETIALGYRVTIYDHMDGGTSYARISAADFNKYWVSRAI